MGNGAPIIRRDIRQGTQAWHDARAGKFSASQAATIMGDISNPTLLAYLKDLGWERVYGQTDSGFKSKAMDRGHVVEPEARDWFAFTRDVVVEEVGLVEHAFLPNVVWSPDGLFDDGNRGIEAKCPLHRAWMDCKRTGKVPAEYRWQCKWAMWVGQLDELAFIAYHPLPGGITVPCEITDADCDAMAERIALLEPRVQVWVDILSN